MDGDLKRTFILHAVQDYLQQVEDTLPVIIRKKKIGDTQELINSIRTRSVQSGDGAIGKLMFAEQGRMVDMGVGRSYPLGGIKAVTVELLSQKKKGVVSAGQSGRKPKKWYSPVIYAKLSYLESKLMFGFTEEVKDELRRMQT